MTASIMWLVPTDLNKNPSVTYSISVYVSTGVENGPYSVIYTGLPAGPGNTTSTYTDPNGQLSYFYYVTYTPSGGVEGSPVLAMLQPTIRQTRLMTKVYTLLPEVIQVRMDANKTQVLTALTQAMSIVNAYAPVTSYSVNNMPPYHEAAVELGAQIFIYLEQMLQISIRDFGYGVSGISLQIDRGAKINTALANLTKYWNDYIKVVKFSDYPDPIGLGSSAIAVPQARVLGFLYNL